MRNQIKKINIKNFKCFEDFEAEGFARVNLMTGKNNVGKTAFMEACFLSESVNPTEDDIDKIFGKNFVFNKETTAHKLVIFDMHRDIHNFYNKWLSGKYNIREIEIENIVINGASFDLNDALKSKYSNFDNIAKDPKFPYFGNSCFMHTNLIFDEYIRSLIGDIKINKKIRKLNEILSNIFNIQSIDDINNKIMLETDAGYQILSNFGDGTKHFLNIIITLFSNKNKVVYLDEIDNGIHYSIFDKLWEIVLTQSKEQNIQVFATTHSKECIESYARVAKKLEDEDITLIELGKVDNKIDSIVFNYAGILHQVKQKLEVRGW